ncbi:BT4734/BF3469 family protein [Polaribacter sp.]|uniref:BT4734/BF3469 family protein n=1 Tax=Polaribacter sp. TaxID=1920175 RepID=UPI003F6D30F5
MRESKYIYFATHLSNPEVITRVIAGANFEILDDHLKLKIKTLAQNFNPKKTKLSLYKYCQKFIEDNQNNLIELINEIGENELELFLVTYIKYAKGWNASSRSYGENSNMYADKISEEDLINEMTDPNGSIKELLDAAQGNLSVVKPFLPATLISLDTNTRAPSKMNFEHTGRFCFDIDKLESLEDAMFWMNKIWKGTQNIKPYMIFISPRGKGVKVFCQIDRNSDEFQKDFNSYKKEVVVKNHKVWYEGGVKELIKTFPAFEKKIDLDTIDPQRLTYLPFIQDKKNHFKYDSNRYSKYIEVAKIEIDFQKRKLEESIRKKRKEIDKVKKSQKISSDDKAYQYLLQNRSSNYDIDYEKEKFIKTIDFIEELATKDVRINTWVSETFNDYSTLNKLGWTLYATFGDMAIEQIKRLIPIGSNKLDEDHNDYRWAIKSKDDYTTEQLNSMTAGAFYELVRKQEKIKDFLNSTYGVNAKQVSEFKIIRNIHENYIQNKELDAKGESKVDPAEFINHLTDYLDKGRKRLPLFDRIENIKPEINLIPQKYLDKKTMENLYQNKYQDKTIFYLISQCGSGKNSLAGHPTYKLKGKSLILCPFQSIVNQIAKEAWILQNRENQAFIHSKIHKVIDEFKDKDGDKKMINYEKSLHDFNFYNIDTVHTTYNQLLNISNREMALWDYIYIDEAHTFANSLDYRDEVIAKLIYRIVDFIASNPNTKTKIIFQSGTPNLEYLVIEEMMKANGIDHLFQTIKVDKKYKKTPVLHLTPLETSNSSERTDAVISQILKYHNKGRKVCHIFNNKKGMSKYIREIQTKLSKNLKVGLFYSGSKGKCTQNILSGKFDEYDVILTTTYFFNGLNINTDGLSEDDILKGKTSTQKYGVVIDLGKKHTKVSAIDAIQAINRFRNRECQATIFLPQFFKEDKRFPSRKFNYNHAGKVILGLNRYNQSLLSKDSNAKSAAVEPIERKEKVHLLDAVRYHEKPVTYDAISEMSTQDKNKRQILNQFDEKSIVYEDWLYSADGYYYLSEKAKMLAIPKYNTNHKPLKKMTKDQIELENKVVCNFINNDKALIYLSNQLEINRRFYVEASNKVKDPKIDQIDNLVAIDKKGDKYVIEGDFHYSHERIINRLIHYHLQLSYWYGTETGIKILRELIKPNSKLLIKKSKMYIENISMYVKQGHASGNKKNLKALNYIRGLFSLRDSNVGVTKNESLTSITLSIDDPKTLNLCKEMWAKQQYKMISYNLKSKDNRDNNELEEYFKNEEAIKSQDLEDLKTQLNYIAYYKPMKVDENENALRPEIITIPKILYSKLLVSQWGNFNEKHTEPEQFSLDRNNKELERFKEDFLDKMKTYVKDGRSSFSVLKTYVEIKNNLMNKGIENAKNFINSLHINVDKQTLNQMTDTLDKLKKDLSQLDQIFLAAFKNAEYMTHKENHKMGIFPFIEDNFFLKKDFNLEDLNDDLKLSLDDKSTTEIYDSLKANDNTYIRAKRQSFNKDTIKKCYVALDVNNNIIFSYFSRMQTIKNLCVYASKNSPFKLKDGSIPQVLWNRGTYNIDTFRKNYYNNNCPSKTIANYSIKIFPVKVQEYVDYAKSLKKNARKIKN